MKKEEITQFFAYWGEICRDIPFIEFLMRCAIARHNGEIKNFPTPPYTKGKIYKNITGAFSPRHSFETIRKKFISRFPSIPVPVELTNLRNAMAHGIIADINKSGLEELIKFKTIPECNDIEVEFHLPLEMPKLKAILENLYVLKRHLMEVAKD